MFWVRSHRWRTGQTWDGITMPAYALYLVRQGKLEVTLNGRPFLLTAGDAWLHAHSQRRTIRVLRDATWFSLGFTATMYEHVDALAQLSPSHWQPARHDHIKDWLETLVREDQTRTSAGELIRDGLVRAIVGWCWQSLAGDPHQLLQHELPDWLGRALGAINQNCNLSVSDLAHDSGYSPSQFRRRFHQVMRCSPRDYLMRRRLETARHLLVSTDDPVFVIAHHCGFSDAAQFSRYFKRAYGVAPLRLRQIAKQPNIGSSLI
jgi:AraC-like DNA-binding protein